MVKIFYGSNNNLGQLEQFLIYKLWNTYVILLSYINMNVRYSDTVNFRRDMSHMKFKVKNFETAVYM